jgi:CysZ protein
MNLTQMWHDIQIILKDTSIYKYLIPGFVITLVYVSFMWSIGAFHQAEEVDTTSLGWLGKLSYWLMSGFKWFSTMLFEFTVITLFSPIMALLSERCDTILTGREYEFTFDRFVKELLRTIGILATGFVFSSIVMGLWFLISWIGNLSIISPYILFVLKAFFIGFNFFDYSFERNMVPIGKSWRYGISKPTLMIAIGAVFSLIFLLPLVGVMLAPFITTIIATIYFLQKNPFENSSKTK